MSSEENKAIVRRFIESYNSRNLDAFDKLVAPDYVDHTHRQQGLEKFKNLFTMAFLAFPDWHEQIEEIVAEGEMVWVRVTATGTHTGEWNLAGVLIPPTGRKLTLRMVFIWRVVNGRLAEGREVDDSMEFLRQLGLIEYTALGRKAFAENLP
jgi:C-1 hydroxylase